MALTEGREALRFRPWSIKFMVYLMLSQQQTNPCFSLLSMNISSSLV